MMFTCAKMKRDGWEGFFSGGPTSGLVIPNEWMWVCVYVQLSWFVRYTYLDIMILTVIRSRNVKIRFKTTPSKVTVKCCGQEVPPGDRY